MQVHLTTMSPTSEIAMTLKERFDSAPDFTTYLVTVEKNAQLWHALYERSTVSPEVVEQLASLPPLRLLALSEDWCGDATNSLPVIARMAEASPSLELRVLGRDANPDLMDTHLTGTSRSIPVVMVLDESFEELAWWGPRPSELQDWVVGTGLGIESRERYRRVRAWYARDRGRTTAEEVLAVLKASLPRRAA